MALYVQLVRKDVLNKRCENVRILTAAKRVNLHFLANLLIKKHINFTKKLNFARIKSH